MTSNTIQSIITEFVAKLEYLAMNHQKLEPGDMQAYLLAILSELKSDDGTMIQKFERYKNTTLRQLGGLLSSKDPYFTDFFSIPFFIFNYIISGPIGLDDGFPLGKPDILLEWFKSENLLTKDLKVGDIIVFEVLEEKKRLRSKKSKNNFFSIAQEIDPIKILAPVVSDKVTVFSSVEPRRITHVQLGKKLAIISSEKLLQRQLTQFKSAYDS